MLSTLINKTKKISVTQLQLILVLLAMLLTIQIQYIQHGWINPDSVLYFESARLFANGEWQQGFNVFKWPLYALLIAFIHKVTTLDIHTSAQLLSVIFFGITTASFIKIIELGGGGKIVMLAGGLILFSSSYLAGDILEMLMRDQGFWAFFLTSLVFFIRFYRTHHYQDAFFWQISAIIATLFRIEGITYLIALPLILLFNHQPSFAISIRNFIKCNFINIISIIIILIAVFILKVIPVDNLGRLNEVFTANLYVELTNKLFTQSAIMGTDVLGSYLDEFAVQGILLTFIYVMIAKTISATGLVNAGLAAFSIWFKKSTLNNEISFILKATAMIAVINMALIIIKVFVLSGRYVLALSLVLMIFAAFYLAELFKYILTPSKTEKKMKWLVVALIVFMSLSIVKNILPKRDGYNYMQDAVAWLNAKNESKQPVFFDDSRIRYYAGAPFIGTWDDTWIAVKTAIENKSIDQYEFLVINHSYKQADREQILAKEIPQYSPIKKFNDANNKKSVVIYQKKQAE
ncbi:MAG TPA: hypothetical protein VK967_00170 [Methylotenera sp.]|nr:hypothetical protein [Methylotenera sp.]